MVSQASTVFKVSNQPFLDEL